jgi:hypothetical protein
MEKDLAHALSFQHQNEKRGRICTPFLPSLFSLPAWHVGSIEAPNRFSRRVKKQCLDILPVWFTPQARRYRLHGVYREVALHENCRRLRVLLLDSAY